MKKLLYLVIIALLSVSCGSSKKQLQNGNYDIAIQKSVKKLLKHPDNENDVEILTKSFRLANNQDIERIKYLKMEGKPENWEEIAQIYHRLKRRQQIIQPVMPLELRGEVIKFDYVDYNRELVESRHKAAEFFYAHGQKLMSNNTKESYRQAYYEFSKVKEYWGDYKNIDELLMRSRELGVSRALVTVDNKSKFRLSEDFKNSLLAINPQDLDSDWVEYYTKDLDDNVEFDYHLLIMLKIMDVSPDHVKETDWIEKKKVDDGFEYVLDSKGNVKKDSLGNDIKVKKYKNLTCTVIETTQSKSAHIEGDLEIYQMKPLKLLRKEPLGADSHFSHLSARAIGDMDALSEETLNLVKVKPLPFPNDDEMIMLCSQGMKQAIRGVLRRNKQYLY
jgi:hypothetical protein